MHRMAGATAGTLLTMGLLLGVKTAAPRSPLLDTARPMVGTSQPHESADRMRDLLGPNVRTPFGDVQVRVTVVGTRITDVQPLAMPTLRPRSAFVSSRVAPVLRAQVLGAHGVRIDGVSGATYTSAAFARSVLGALRDGR